MPSMASVNINYLRENELPVEVRKEVEQLKGSRILSGSRLCIALFNGHVIAASGARPAAQFARLDFLSVAQEHIKTRLGEVVLNHSLKQLHKAGVNEVNTAVSEQQLQLFLDAGFMEENITIPGMHDKTSLTELVHPNLDSLGPRFKLIGDNPKPIKKTSEKQKENDMRSIRFDSMGSYRDLCRMVICNAQQKVFMLCESLDDPILNDREVISHIQELVLHSRHVEVRLLLENDRHPSSGHSAILDLAQRLSSFVSIRKIHDKRIAPKEWLYLCDDLHAVERRREHGYKGQAFVESPMTLQRLSYQFENLWLHSAPSSELRRLAI